MWFDSQKHFEVKRLILKLTHALGSRPDCVRVEAVISVPTMQRASVMAAHWCHLYHMGGYKHYICDWETATSGFNTTINRRLCSKTVSTARSSSRFRGVSWCRWTQRSPSSEAFWQPARRRNGRRTLSAPQVRHRAVFVFSVSRSCDALSTPWHWQSECWCGASSSR